MLKRVEKKKNQQYTYKVNINLFCSLGHVVRTLLTLLGMIQVARILLLY